MAVVVGFEIENLLYVDSESFGFFFGWFEEVAEIVEKEQEGVVEALLYLEVGVEVEAGGMGLVRKGFLERTCEDAE